MEAAASSNQYRGCSSSAGRPSTPAAATTNRRYYFPRLGRPVSFEDSPDWGDDITAAPSSSSIHLASLASSAYPSPSPSIPEPSASAPAFRERKVAGAALVWKELTVSVRDRCRSVKGSSGYALPGTLTVVMGPARSGKSTLLRAIAGRLHGAERVYGEVFVNGVKSPLPYGSYGYVDRDDVLIESLTVREMLYYSAFLQLPSVFSSKKPVMDDAIAAMSLDDNADKLIGGHCFNKRLPTGERRRVSIARELVMRPHVLFIDEPLYHLDGEPVDKRKIQELKSKGSNEVGRKDFLSAVEFYSMAMELDPDNATLFSNRSLCWLELGKPLLGLLDSLKCGKRRPDWPKALYRQSKALMSLKDYMGACEAFLDALKLDPGNAEVEDGLRNALLSLKVSRRSKAD